MATSLSCGQRKHDLEILVENVAMGMLDLAERLERPEELNDTLIREAEYIEVRYDSLWEVLHAEPVFGSMTVRVGHHPSPQRTRLRRRRVVAATGQRRPRSAPGARCGR